LYTFADEQKKGWLEFWKDMDGDRDKILDFAKKADVDNPEEWFNSLHKFLFDLFAGDVKLLRKAAKKSFGEFLAQVAENHVNDPKPTDWYYLKGLRQRDFVRVMEYASMMPDVRGAIAYVNARTPEYGAKLYNEWLLSKTPQNKELKSIASDMNKKAYEIEKEATGKDGLLDLTAETKVKHAAFPGEVFTAVEVDDEEAFVVVEDKNEKENYVFDIWNLEIV
jgi:hypothetical protein